MKRTFGLMGAAIIGLAAVASPARAAWADSPLAKASFGETWSGPAVSPQALAGKVVLVKIWAEW